MPESMATPGNIIGLQAIDLGGRPTQHWYEIETFPVGTVDINGDGVVNILDLVLVASAFGKAGTSQNADINGDGMVNILDLVLVANAFGG